METIVMRQPDDFHCHLREGEILKFVAPFTAGIFGRGLAMGNLARPITTAYDAVRYYREIVRACGSSRFKPIMSIMLTKKTNPNIIGDAGKRGIKTLKLIPGNTSTNSEDGISLWDIERSYLNLAAAQSVNMVFSIHCELLSDESGNAIPEEERESKAISFLDQLITFLPKLKIVIEHASTRDMIDYVKRAPENVAATLTLHHATLTRDDVYEMDGSIISHNYCKPIAKTADDREAVIEAMMSGNPKFFFGSDSAPHLESAKMRFPPAAGIFTAPVVLPALCDLFERRESLGRLEDFVSRFGSEFYGLPLNSGTIEIRKREWIAPEYIGGIKVFLGGTRFGWRVDSPIGLA
ncbi:MAG: dihydroorotase [Candidatus Colwellbacteria bacterium]|nr:dihydroorotase [Candidatus Colwellbacteria bacterium]